MPHTLPRPVLWLLPVVLVVALVHPIHADDWPVPFGPSHEPEPYQYQPKHLKQAPPEFFDDAPACLVYYGVTHLVQANGTTETIVHEVTRLNGKKGIENLGEYRSISYDPAYQKLKLNVARVHKADGKVIPIEPKHVKLRDSSTDYSSYDQEKELVISFPGLEVGDLYEVKWTTIGQHPENQGHFFRQYLFGSANYPVMRDSFLVRLPKDRPLKFKSINGTVTPTVREEGGQRFYHWTVTNHPALPRDEDLPSKEELRLQLVCSTFGSWPEVGKWKQYLRKDCWECTPAIKQIVQQVTAGMKSPEQKAAALTYWVRKKIRYVSVVSATHRYTPSKPHVVLDNLYGDCKDQAQLLAVMLREAGLKVFLVTLGQRDDGQVVPDVPSPWGTHAIVMARIGGVDHWIDTTSTFAGWDFLPRADRDRVVILTDETGNIEIARTPKLNADDNRISQTTTVMVQPDGSSLCQRVALYHGLAAIGQRNKWVDTPAGECRRLMTAQLLDAHGRTQLLNLKLNPANLLNPDQPVIATIEFQIAQHFAGKTYLEASVSDSNIWNRLLAYHPDYDRQPDLVLWAPFESTHRYLVQLPPAFRFDTESSEKVITSKWGSFLVRVERDPTDDRKLEVFFYTTLEETRIKPADFAAYRKFHQQVQDAWRVWLGIIPTKKLDDALALEAVLACAPGDLATARSLANLYKKHGREADVQRVLKGALIHQPFDKALWEMLVATTATLADEENVYRQMVQRFPDETKYALALATTCMVRGNYAGATKILEPLTKSDAAEVRSRAYYHLAKIAYRQNDSALTLQHMQQANKEDAAAVHTVPALTLLAQAQEKLGQRDLAIKTYQQALAVKADAKEVLSALVSLELAAGRPVNALDWLRQFAPLVKGHVEGLNQAAAFYLHLNRLDDALDLALLARDTTFHAGTQKILGLIYLKKNDYAKAVFHLDRANADAEVLAGLIQGNFALGDLGRALDHLTAAKAITNPSEALTALTARCTALTQRRTALQNAKIPAEKQDLWSSLVDRFLCAEFAHQTGHPAAEVKKLLAPCFTAELPFGPAHALRALLELEKGQIKSALKDAALAIELCPQEPRGWYVRGRLRHETGHKDALPDLQHAAKLSNRKDAAILHWLAAAQFDAGQHKEAIATQQEALKLMPGEPELVEQLQRFQKGASK